jgi:hypothetical protein
MRYKTFSNRCFLLVVLPWPVLVRRNLILILPPTKNLAIEDCPLLAHSSHCRLVATFGRRRQALTKIIAAAKLLDPLFLRQVWSGNDALKQKLEAGTKARARSPTPQLLFDQ